jgi:hypothetical protein
MFIKELLHAFWEIDELCEGGWGAPRPIRLCDKKGENGRESRRGWVFPSESFPHTKDVAKDSKREAEVGRALMFEENE